jgi:hypothetical protein
MWRATGIDDQRLKDSEHELDHLVKVVAFDARAGPVDVAHMLGQARLEDCRFSA